MSDWAFALDLLVPAAHFFSGCVRRLIGAQFLDPRILCLLQALYRPIRMRTNSRRPVATRVMTWGGPGRIVDQKSDRISHSTADDSHELV